MDDSTDRRVIAEQEDVVAARRRNLVGIATALRDLKGWSRSTLIHENRVSADGLDSTSIRLLATMLFDWAANMDGVVRGHMSDLIAGIELVDLEDDE